MKRSPVLIAVMLLTLFIPHQTMGMADAPEAPTNLPNLSSIISVADQASWDYYAPSVAYNWKHNEYFVVWHSPDSGVLHIYGQRINALTGQRIGAQPDVIAGGSQDKYQPDVDYDPVHDRYLVVWTHSLAATEYNISGRFVPWDGSDPILGEFTITQFSCYEYDPRVAYGRADQQFMVVGAHFCGANPQDVWGQMVPADGTGFNPMINISVSAHGTYGRSQPDIAWNRATNEFMVVYTNEVSASGGGTEWDVYGALFNGSGVRVPGNLHFALASNDEVHPAVASAGNHNSWLVVWQEMVSGDYDLKGEMRRGDLSTVSYPVISAYGGHQQHARVSSNYGENGFMVVYEEDISGNIGISGRSLALDGTMGSGLQVRYATASGNISPAVIGGHSNYMTVWAANATQAVHGKFITPYAVFLPAAIRQP